MNSDFLNLLKRIVDADIDFVVVGGFAGVVHGSSYVTQDIDICCDFSPDNLLSLQKAIADTNPIHRMTPKKIKLSINPQNIEQLKNLYIDTDIGQLDCLSFIDGIGDFENVKKQSVSVEVDGLKIHILSIDALIKAKQAMNRPHDKLVIEQLQAIKKLKNNNIE